MGRLLLALLALLALPLIGCATTKGYEEVLASYVGAPESTLIAKWGPPDSVYESGETKYLSYQKANSGYVPGVAPTYQTTCSFGICTTRAVGGSPGFAYNNQCKTTFTVSGGMISNWRWEGNSCRA